MELLKYARFDPDTNATKYDSMFTSQLPNRPKYNTAGKEIQIRVNQFKILGYPQKDIFQYDVLIGSGGEKRGLIKTVWESKIVQSQLRSLSQNWIWNGDKIAWCDTRVPRNELRITVDLDVEKGRPPRPDKPNVFYCHIKMTKVVRLAVIDAYLTQKMAFDNAVLEAINFMDHLMRQMPSRHYCAIKRSYFARGGNRFELDNNVEAMKGVYSSLRLCDKMPSFGQGTGVALNVDVANGTFWSVKELHTAARDFCADRNRRKDWGVFHQLIAPVKGPTGPTMSEEFKNLRKMTKLKFTVAHQTEKNRGKIYTIKRFTFPKSFNNPEAARFKYATEGQHAKNTFFILKSSPGATTGEEISIFNYYKKKYGRDLQFPLLPLVETERAGFFPMELCTIAKDQQYKFKLSPDQTSKMIKFAVTRPKDRIGAISHGVGMLKWNQDDYLKAYGLQVDPSMSMTKARLLPNPEVQFGGNAKLNPGTQGRWDLRGKKFLFGNKEPLKSWGVCVMEECVNKAQLDNFLKVFIQIYIGHGGNVANKSPTIYVSRRGEDIGEMVGKFRTAVGNANQQMPQIMLYVLKERNSFTYERLKKNMECRFATVSQMMNCAHVAKAQPQYCSNVCMKLNAKLGGTTCKVFDKTTTTNWSTSFFSKPGDPTGRPTMIIGADVSHPSPGSPQASMAALTMSFDRFACRYAAAVQTNGHRVEMITEGNINSMMMPLFHKWIQHVGGGKGPQHIYYFRDGVSEGQYSHVLEQEVTHMKKAIEAKYGQNAKDIRWTVVICSKRHHIRFFPKDGDNIAGDKNSNAVPGTLVERDVTHPFEYDFYLNAHSALQGTARPVHYQVILDEAQVAPNDFHKMIYQMSYQYMRSTTPVSLFPAVYYAHLASNRARAHEDAPSSGGPRGGQKFMEQMQDDSNRQNFTGRPPTSQTGSSGPLPTEARPLVPLGAPNNSPEMLDKIRCGMWYI
ncbi:eukaryotic translation initiation factor-like protein 2C 2 [Coleophoma cylindrospora]|uniref:Eukaryotic translation initiation factor-like protein 2C 2 n=1 Tax=Coleophoma cylindrospora TaxID=1849047 RepID=A0A3D8R201_9HELO|nr:eukaryotic translation initiation factor-like protein 2C 2 [Coleophoma cylindrospora]